MTDARSRQLPPAGTLHRIFEVVAAVGVVACVGSLAISWEDLPPRVPVHFAWDGRPDGIGSRGVLVFVASVGVLVYALLTVLTRFPWKFSYPGGFPEADVTAAYTTARTLVTCCKAFSTAVFAWTVWRSIQTALGRADGLGVLFGPVVVVFAIGLLVFQLRWTRRLRRRSEAR